MGKKQGYWFDFDNYVHPEQGPHEYFLGNSFNDSEWVSAFSLCSWKTKRLGRVAYDKHGEIVTGCKPFFASREEVENGTSALDRSNVNLDSW